MTFHLPSAKLFVKIVITLVVMILLGFILLVLVYSLPTDNIIKHVKDSVEVFQSEGLYPELDSSTSKLDSYTDALMLLEASYDGPDNATTKALLVPHWSSAELENTRPEYELIEKYLVNPDTDLNRFTYARYWHGFLIFLKPMLMFFTYNQLSSINPYIQIALTLAIVILMIIKKCWHAIPAYILCILMLHPLATAFCLQFATVFYIFTISNIILLLFRDAFSSSIDGIYLFFVIIGAATAYLDFLTYPIATFGMVATMYICLQRDDKTDSDVRNIINLLICWIIGYGIMFASKWALATLLTEENIIADAISVVQKRSSDLVGETTVSKFETIYMNIATFLNTPFYYVSGGLLVVEIVVLILSKSKFVLRVAVSLIFVLILPMIWYLLVTNHSFIHTFFTNKALVGSLFALLCIFIPWDFLKKKEDS